MDRTVPLTSSTSCDTENTSFNPPLSTGSVKLLFEKEEKKTVEVAGEDTECPVEPPKLGEESMETVVEKDSIDVGEKTGAVEEGDVGDNEEERFVSCEKDGSPDKAIENGSMSEKKIVPEPAAGIQDKTPEETDQESVSAEKQDIVPSLEEKESDTPPTEIKTALEKGDIPSVSQAGQLFAKDKPAHYKSDVPPNETKNSGPSIDRELSVEERKLM